MNSSANLLSNGFSSLLNSPDLTVRFSSVELPDTIELWDTGKVQVIVSNRGNAPLVDPLYLTCITPPMEILIAMTAY